MRLTRRHTTAMLSGLATLAIAWLLFAAVVHVLVPLWARSATRLLTRPNGRCPMRWAFP